MSDKLIIVNDNFSNNTSYYYDLTNINELRDNSKKILGRFMKSEKNINTLENYIFDYSYNKKEYADTLKYIIGILYEKELKDIINDIKTRKIHFDSDIYEDARDNIRKEVNKIQTPVEVVEGMFTCKKCGSKKTHHVAIQTRRSDEPPTIDIRCLNKECMYRWRIG
jgi:DNA-directed RNA polymerase subunit M/transcription elongation factor TFIIS